jgi:hypothetical protein
VRAKYRVSAIAVSAAIARTFRAFGHACSSPSLRRDWRARAMSIVPLIVISSAILLYPLSSLNTGVLRLR